MDPLTQGVMGVVAAQQIAKPQRLLLASFLGLASGMAPDLDIFLRSETDPLLALEFHRQFTHSLFFIPFGGLICATFFFFLLRPIIRRSELSFLQVLGVCTIAYSTHGLLDAYTSYGTQLLWPFSDARIAWDIISIIDPIFTVPLLLLVILAIVYRSSPILAKRFSLAALLWVVSYSTLGIVQRERAETAAWELAKQRGHTPIVLEAKPSFANVIVWKVIYSTATDYYVDAVRASWDVDIYEGVSIPKLDLERDFPWLDAESQQAIDVERFRWFSNGYLAVSPEHSRRIIDMRYSFIPNQVTGMWGIELNPDAAKEEHITYVFDRRRDRQTFRTLWEMVSGTGVDTQ